MPSSPDEMMAAMMKNIVEKTGQDINYWIKIAESSGETKHMAIIKHLKTNHGMSHGYANLVAFKVRENDNPAKSEDDILIAQYAKKQELKPIYDLLANEIQKLDKNISRRVCKGYVAFRTSKQFVILKPSTKTRMDVGLMLKGNDTTERLKSGKVFSGMMTHHVEVYSKDDCDKELLNWISEAFQMAS